MALQVIVHGIPLRVFGPRQWIRHFYSWMMGQPLGGPKHQAPIHRSTAPGQERPDDNLGIWVGAIRVSQEPDSFPQPHPPQAQNFRPSLWITTDFEAFREGQKVKQIFLQNQIRTGYGQSGISELSQKRWSRGQGKKLDRRRRVG